MADDKMTIQPGAEFQSLPLEFIVSAPLTAAVRAQAIAAKATQEYIEAFKNTTVDFSMQVQDNGSPKTMNIKAPLLACVPVPHLRIDSITTHFHYEITQTSMTRCSP